MAAPPDLPPRPPATPRTVLLVEDDPTYQVVLQTALRRAGYTVQLAATVPEMRAHLSAAAASHALPHLVILDWLLPGGETGPEALRWLRSQRHPRIQTLPVLVLTAARRPARIRRQALDAGATECLPKVTALHRIAHTVATLIQAADASIMRPPAPDRGCPLVLAGHQAIRADRGTRIALTPNQAALLSILLEEPGEIVPYSTIESRLLPLHTARRALLRRRVYRLNQRLKRLGVRVRSSRRDAGYRFSWE